MRYLIAILGMWLALTQPAWAQSGAAQEDWSNDTKTAFDAGEFARSDPLLERDIASCIERNADRGPCATLMALSVIVAQNLGDNDLTLRRLERLAPEVPKTRPADGIATFFHRERTWLLLRMDKVREGLAAAQQWVDFAARSLPDDGKQNAFALNALADASIRMNLRDVAEKHFAKAVSIGEDAFEPGDPDLLSFKYYRALNLLVLQELVQALNQFEAIVPLLREGTERQHRYLLGYTKLNLAYLTYVGKAPDLSAEHFAEALKTFGDNPELAQAEELERFVTNYDLPPPGDWRAFVNIQMSRWRVAMADTLRPPGHFMRALSRKYLADKIVDAAEAALKRDTVLGGREQFDAWLDEAEKLYRENAETRAAEGDQKAAADSMVKLAEAQMLRSRYGDAQATMEMAIQTQGGKGQPRHYEVLGDVFDKQDKFAEAEAQYALAISSQDESQRAICERYFCDQSALYGKLADMQSLQGKMAEELESRRAAVRQIRETLARQPEEGNQKNRERLAAAELRLSGALAERGMSEEAFALLTPLIDGPYAGREDLKLEWILLGASAGQREVVLPDLKRLAEAAVADGEPDTREKVLAAFHYGVELYRDGQYVEGDRFFKLGLVASVPGLTARDLRQIAYPLTEVVGAPAQGRSYADRLKVARHLTGLRVVLGINAPLREGDLAQKATLDDLADRAGIERTGMAPEVAEGLLVERILLVQRAFNVTQRKRQDRKEGEEVEQAELIKDFENRLRYTTEILDNGLLLGRYLLQMNRLERSACLLEMLYERTRSYKPPAQLELSPECKVQTDEEGQLQAEIHRYEGLIAIAPITVNGGKLLYDGSNQQADIERSLAATLVRAGQARRAEKHYRNLLERSLRLFEKSGSGIETVLWDHVDLSFSLREQTRYSEAEELVRSGIRLSQENGVTASRGLSFLLSELAQLLDAQGEFEEARALHMRALRMLGEAEDQKQIDNDAMMQAAAIAEHGRLSGREDVASNAAEMGLKSVAPYLERGQVRMAGYQQRFITALPLSERLPHLQKLLAFYHSHVPADHLAIAQTKAELARVKEAGGDVGGAEELYSTALARMRQALPTADAKRTTLAGDLARTLLSLERYPRAYQIADEATDGAVARIEARDAFDENARREMNAFAPIFMDKIRAAWKLSES